MRLINIYTQSQGFKPNICAFLLYFVASAISFSLLGTVVHAEKPRYVHGVESIVHSHQYIREHAATIYWKVSPYYISQRNGSSCSLATSTMIVNAARSNKQLVANEQLATQNGLLTRVKNKEWSDNVKDDGNGVTLDQLHAYLPKAMEAYGLHNFTLELVHTKNSSKENQTKLHNALVESEKTGQTFIIVNFNQQFISGTESVGHFAPIGAYDSQSKRVLIMDPDRELFEPYWMPEKLLLESMATQDDTTKVYRGYLLVKMRHQN